MDRYGLIGYPLGHSFSKKYFTDKFSRERISNARYDLYPLATLEEFPALLHNTENLKGINVTIPYKQSIIPYLDQLNPAAAVIGAVNTIKFTASESQGFNTDWIGFTAALLQFIPEKLPGSALILGTGGSSKAVAYALTQLGINFRFISRDKRVGMLTYDELNRDIISEHLLIINTTPLGMFPEVESNPPIPYHFLTGRHFLFDLVYNPRQTRFMQLGAVAGANVCNGESMLYAQAEAAWNIWNS